MNPLRLFVALLVFSLAGCSARIAVRELPDGDVAVDGLPFRVKERFRVEVYQKTDKGYVKVAEEMQSLPNPNRVYLLQHFGKALADSDTKFSLRTDGTLSSVSLTSTSRAAETVTGLGDQVAGLAKQVSDLREARTAKTKQQETDLQATEKSEIDYITAYNAAVLADQQLTELGPNELASTRLAKQNEVRSLKLQANIKARQANLPRPFPDATLP